MAGANAIIAGCGPITVPGPMQPRTATPSKTTGLLSGAVLEESGSKISYPSPMQKKIGTLMNYADKVALKGQTGKQLLTIAEGISRRQDAGVPMNFMMAGPVMQVLAEARKLAGENGKPTKKECVDTFHNPSIPPAGSPIKEG